ncbi:PDDEXK nuclease domain-containing protein [Curtobacterium oceanosedimentum]|uniref:PDDEXK nuclease domain-containing protein n=1 Tax=Curtobacterium oceanosedimentum TaxID=465820 RepID=UPI001CE0AC8F|nr:PDDEXK nuclease domain-containing protein [Curtobacterium oceanosedimentum]MCA5922113.1 PDDEXK nuclease domain-containing protein [Curtobacterium oceanosedimentum]
MTDDAALPDEYAETLRSIRDRVTATRGRVQLAANAHLVHLYWSIGSVLLERSRAGRWGSGVLNQLAADLRTEFPSMKGLSATNLKYMRQFAATWPDEAAIGQQSVDRLPWGHVTVLLGLPDQSARIWYVRAAVQGGWPRNVLRHNIRSRLWERAGAAPTNFSRLLDADGEDLAQQITRDPYVLDFLAVDGDRDERTIESAMVDRIADTLRELGSGFAFVGRQVHFDVDGSDFFVDLLFFHVEQLRYVVVELKRGEFRPDHVGQLSFYVALVDARLRRARHAETVGLLLVAGKNDAVVRYSLGASNAPVGVASYDLLPPEIRQALPTEAQLQRALRGRA